jgi:hypothetical protein
MTPSARNITTLYSPTAIYYEDADFVEYVRKDVLSVNDRVDEFLTLIYSMNDRTELIGFRFNGFKNAFLRGDMKSQLGDDFLTAVGAIERVLTRVGDQVFGRRRKQAYNLAARMAVEDGVRLNDLPKVARR